MTSPSPRDLDPKFKDANLTEADLRKNEDTDKVNSVNEPHRDETPQETLARLASGEIPNDPNEGFIVHKSRYTDENGVQREKTHGPMPVSEWAEYSRQKGF